jgi:GT2 family glycosyltransferase
MLPKIFIVILNWNGKNDTLECLASVAKINYPNFITLVIDNGSTDDSVEAFQKEFPQIKILKTEKNLGFAEGNNVGIRYALGEGADGILLLNNDTIVDPNLLRGFVKGMEEHPKAGILGAKIYLYKDREHLDHLGGNWNPKKGCFDFIGNHDLGENWQKSCEMEYVCGAAFYVKREVLVNVGFLEPKFFLVWEESDFCFRARKLGYQVLSCMDAKIWHKVSSSFVGGKPHSNYFWWRNRLLWMQRNRPFSEVFSFYARILFPEVIKNSKLYFLKCLQLLIIKTIFPNKDHSNREKKILQYRAILQGIGDYFLRRFGNGPSWIYSQNDSLKKKLSAKSTTCYKQL